ncbi:hypothetical protein IGI04_010232, partial [Brassica rapa subsp. trilocularis]
VETQLKRSILINVALSLVGFFVTLKMIHVAARYVLRRNTFGFDINKSGTPQVEVKVNLDPSGDVFSYPQMVTMHSLIKLKSQEQTLALPEPALIKISNLLSLFAIGDTALLFASSELTYAISMFQ